MLRPADVVLRAASALLDASSKATARKMENVGFIWAPPCRSIEVACNGSLLAAESARIAANNVTSL